MKSNTKWAVVSLLFWSCWINTAYSHTKNFELFQDDQLIGAVTLQLNQDTHEEALPTTNSKGETVYYYYFNRDLINPLALFDVTPRPLQHQLTCFLVHAEREPNRTQIKRFVKAISHNVTAPDQLAWSEEFCHKHNWQQPIIIDPALDIALRLLATEVGSHLSCYMSEPTRQSEFVVDKNELTPEVITLTSTGFSHNLELKIQHETEQSSTITVEYTIEGQSHTLIYRPVKAINFSTLRKPKKKSRKEAIDTTANDTTASDTTDCLKCQPPSPKPYSPTPPRRLTTAFQPLSPLPPDVSAIDTYSAHHTMTDWITPENPNFIHDLQEHGDKIYTFLKKDIEIKPRLRTCPMPGMTTFVTRLASFVNNNILTDAKVPEEDKGLYKKLTTDLQQLVSNNCPWNKSFTLAYKAAHFVSFYNKDKAPHFVPAQKRSETDFQQRPCIEKHRSYYKETATLAGLALLPWQDALDNPSHFTTKLNTLWHSHHLKFTNSQKIVWEPLKKLERFCFPCMDELDLAFFNQTWMLGIHPVGFTLEPEILFDSTYGLCAEFFEHDILHASQILSVINPAYFLPVKRLYQIMDNATMINRDHFTLDSLRYATDDRPNQLDFPKEAIELLLFEMMHEHNSAPWNSSLHTYQNDVETLFILYDNEKEKLHPKYSNLKPRYQKVTHIQVKRAALFLYSLEILEKEIFLDAKNSKALEDPQRKARHYYNDLLCYYTLFSDTSPFALDIQLNPEYEHINPSIISEGPQKKIETIIRRLGSGKRDLDQRLPASLYDEPGWKQEICDSINKKDTKWKFFETDDPFAVVYVIGKFEYCIDTPRSIVHVLKESEHRVFKNIDKAYYDSKQGILIFRQPDQYVHISLKGEHSPTIKEFSRTQIKDSHFDKQKVQFFTSLGILNLKAETREYLQIPYAGQHLKCVDFNDTDMGMGDYSGTTFENCNLSQTKLTWDNIKTSHFCGYSLFEPAKLSPAARAAEAWLKKANGDLTERLKAVHKSGLLPFVKLNALQLHELLELQLCPGNESSPLKIANIPFQALLAAPSMLTDSLCWLVRDVLLSKNTSLKLGVQLMNKYRKDYPYPIVKHLLTALNGPEDIRLLISQNPRLDEGVLRCFDSIHFNPEKLKIPEDHESRFTSALCKLSFKKANLNNCDLCTVTIFHCDFTEAQLEGVNFHNTTFDGNVFTRTNLQMACFANANITGPDCNTFEYANMSHCDMTQAYLKKCSFKKAQLDGTQFRRVVLQGDVDLQDASLRGCLIHGAYGGKEFAKVFLPAMPKTSPTLQDQLNQAQMLLWLGDAESAKMAKTLVSQLSPDSMDYRQRQYYISLLENTGQPVDITFMETEFDTCLTRENSTDLGKHLIKYLRVVQHQEEAALEATLKTALIKCKHLPEKIQSEIADYIYRKRNEQENQNIREQIIILKEKLSQP